MTTTVYSSSDVGAPVLNTSVGTLINLLDKCLVTGYGAKSAAGWTKPFTGTNLAAFRQPVGTSNGMYLRVDDTTVGYTQVRGYENMSDINTGTGQFPLAGQAASVYWCKALASPAGDRPWIVIANERGFYFWTTQNLDTSTYGAATVYYFCELRPLDPTDVYCTVLYGDNATTPSTSHQSITAINEQMRSTSTTQYRYTARPFGGTGSSVGINFVSYSQFYSSTTSTGFIFGCANDSANAMAYPNSPNTGLYLAPAQTIEVSSPNCLRGPMRGLWAPLHARPIAHGDTFNGTGALTGKTFMALSVANYLPSTTYLGSVFVEISNTW